MKKISLLVIVAALFFACGGNKKSKFILGSWKIADMAAPMPPNLPDSLKVMMKNQLDQLKANSSFNYKEDGTFAYNMGGQIGNGTWVLNDEATELSLTEGGKTDKSKVIELTDTKFVFEIPQPNGVDNLTLTLAK